MKDTENELLGALASSLFDSSMSTLPLSDGAKAEALEQAVYSLVSRDEMALQIVAQNLRIAWEQQELVNMLNARDIPFAVLKGFSASIYYPEPMMRALGDVDIIVEPKNFLTAFSHMQASGYIPDPEDHDGRHICFRKNSVVIELHQRFASLNSTHADAQLDNWIYEAIPKVNTVRIGDFSFPILQEPLNGLILLAHVSQHLENGLGIRQIIDWVMYVAHELPDGKWLEFQNLTEPLGLTNLAKITARFGQLYLGLPQEDHSWCIDVDDSVCEALLNYVFQCGNFGHKAGMSNTVTMVFSHGSGIIGFFRNLQKRGERNWKAYQKCCLLKPFCWLYQLFRYVRLGLRRDKAFSNLKKDYEASKERNALTKAIGATRLAEKEI